MNGGGDNRVPETEEEKALADVAVERWNDYQARFAPVENQFMKDVRAKDSDYGMNLDKANTTVSESMAGVTKANNINLSQAGAMPGSGRFNAANVKLASKHGETVGAAMNDSNLGVDDMDIAGLDKIVSIGSGQANDTQLGFGNIAANAHKEAVAETAEDVSSAAANLNAIGTATGIGLRYSNDNNP